MKKIFFIFKKIGIIHNQEYSPLKTLLALHLVLILFSWMTYKSLFGYIAASSLILSLLLLMTNKNNSYFQCKDFAPLAFCLSGISISILINQLSIGNFLIISYDGPIRLILCLPLLIAVYQIKIDFAKIISFTAPLALVFILIYALKSPQYYGNRLSNNFYDPILWGNYCMIISFLSLSSVEKTDSINIKIYKISGFVLGLIMSILSQSRASWIAGIVLTFMILILNLRRLSYKRIFIYVVITALTVIILYTTVQIFKNRIDAGIVEILNWKNGNQTDTSIGTRLTMWKIALHLFTLNPLIGYGEYSALPVMNDAYINSFADKESIRTILCCGPHNELAGHALRFGVIGAITLLATYLYPLFIFSRSTNHQIKLMGSVLCFGVFTCGFGTEMLSLKSSYNFYAVMLAGLMGTMMWKRNGSK